MMKRLTAVLAIAVCGSWAHAGGLDDPIIDPVVIEEDTAASSDGILVPIVALILIAAAASH